MKKMEKFMHSWSSYSSGKSQIINMQKIILFQTRAKKKMNSTHRKENDDGDGDAEGACVYVLGRP